MSKKKEKEIQTEIKNQSGSSESSEHSVPILKRDGLFGNEGRSITVKANSFEVTSKILKYNQFLKYTLEIKPVDAGGSADDHAPNRHRFEDFYVGSGRCGERCDNNFGAAVRGDNCTTVDMRASRRLR